MLRRSTPDAFRPGPRRQASAATKRGGATKKASRRVVTLGSAAFVLGPTRGAGFLERQGAGLFMADRCNKLPMVLVFLASYFGLFTLSAFLGDPSRVAEVYRSPDVNAALFFAFFMLDDPPTSPVRYADQVLYSIIVAVVSFAAFETLGAEYFLLAGVLVGNAWESLRRLEENPKPQAATSGCRFRIDTK